MIGAAAVALAALAPAPPALDVCPARPRLATVTQSARAIIEQQLTDARMGEVAQVIALRMLDDMKGDPRIAAVVRHRDDPRTEAIMAARVDAAIVREVATVAGERPGLVDILSRRFAEDFNAGERDRIVAFLASPPGRLWLAGGPASYRQPGITAFFATPTGKRFLDYAPTVSTGCDFTEWRDAAAVRMRTRIVPDLDKLVAELDRLTKDPA